MPFRYSGDMCCRPSTSLPAARCSRTSSSVRGASSSTLCVAAVMAPRRLTLDGRPPTYSVICEPSSDRPEGRERWKQPCSSAASGAEPPPAGGGGGQKPPPPPPP